MNQIHLTLGGFVAGLMLAASLPVAAVDHAGHNGEAPGSAAEGSAAEPDRFSALDLNGDGAIGRDEVYLLTSLARRFNDADLDRDGELSRSEFSAFEAQLPEDRPAPPVYKGTLAKWQLYELIDQNGDGEIGPEEAELYSALEEQFAQADKDGDGQVDRAEFAAFELRAYRQEPGPDEAFE